MVSPSDAYEGERLARMLKGILEADLPGKLDEVEARWQEEAPLTLPNPVTSHLGFNPSLLELESTSFPIVAVIPGERVPEGPAKAWGYQNERIVLDIHFFIVADTLDAVGPMAYRYAEALVLVLQDYHFIGDYEQADYKPEIELGIAGRHPKRRHANLSKEADTDYVQGGRITLELKDG